MLHVDVAEFLDVFGVGAAIEFGMFDVKHKASDTLLNFIAFVVASLHGFIAERHVIIVILLLVRFESFGERFNGIFRPINQLGAFGLVAQTISLEDADNAVVAQICMIAVVHFVGATARVESLLFAEKFDDAIFQDVIVIRRRREIFILALNGLVKVLNKSFNNRVGDVYHFLN